MEIATSPQRRDLRGPESTQRAIAGLRRRSLIVHFWRGALPVVIGAALAVLAVWGGIKAFANLSPNQNGAGDIRMIGPEFHGRNKEGRPYTITAQTAVRDPRHEERSTLTEPRLVMDTLAHGMVHVSSHHGLYDENSKIMNLSGDVVADTDKKEHFTSPTAQVDTNANLIQGRDNVTASSALGQTSGSSYSIDDKQGHVVLTGDVHTHLVPHSVSK